MKINFCLMTLLVGALPLFGDSLTYTFQSHAVAANQDVFDTGNYLRGLIAAGDLVTGTIRIADLSAFSATASSTNYLSLEVDGYTFSTADGQGITWETNSGSVYFTGGVSSSSWPNQFQLLSNTYILVRLDGLMDAGNFKSNLMSSSVTAAAVVANSWNSDTDQYFVRAFIPEPVIAPTGGGTSNAPEPTSAVLGLSALVFVVVKGYGRASNRLR